MKKIVSFLSLFFVVTIFTACGGSSVSKGKTLVDVNGRKITEGDLEFLGTLNPNIAAQLSTPFGKKQILDNLVEQEILYQAAKKEGLDHNRDVQAKIDLYKKVIMAQSFVETSMEKEAKEYYDKNQKEFEKLRLSDIVIRYATPEEMKAAKKAGNPNAPKHSEQEALKLANQVYDKIKGGENFADAAKQFSEDPQTKESGGDLGFVSKEDPKITRRGLSPLLEKAFAMKVSELAGPIKTADGYHIITVTAPAEQAPFEEVKMQIAFKIRGDAKNKILATLKEKSKIVFAEGLQSETSPHVDPQSPPMPGAGAPPASEAPHAHPHGEGDGQKH